MRLLFLSNYYPPHHFGGYEELCAELAHSLQERGHHVAVLTTRRGVRGGDVSGGVYRLLYPEVAEGQMRGTLEFFRGRQQRMAANLRTLDEVRRAENPDALVVWGMWNLSRHLAARAESWGRPPVVYYIADYWPGLADAYTLHWREPARRSYSRAAKAALGRLALAVLAREPQPRLAFAHALCVSQAVRRQLQDEGHVPATAQVLYNGIAGADFAGAAQQRRPFGDTLRLLYAGRLAADKGIETAIDAMTMLAQRGCPARLSIAGGGPLEAALRARVDGAHLGAIVSFLGRVPRAQMPDVLGEHDVLLAPSQWPEPLPRSVQEGMAAGLVVVATRVGGIPEIVEDGVNGLLCAPGDAAGLAAAIARLAADAGLRQSLAAAAQQTVRARFDIRLTVDGLERYLAELAGQQ